MKLLLGAILAAAYLCLLWGPALMVARQAQRSGDPFALRPLRLIWPCQLAAAFALAFAADAVGLPNPAGLFVAATALASVGGAVACKLMGWVAARA